MSVRQRQGAFIRERRQIQFYGGVYSDVGVYKVIYGIELRKRKNCIILWFQKKSADHSLLLYGEPDTLKFPFLFCFEQLATEERLYTQDNGNLSGVQHFAENLSHSSA